MPSLSLKAQGSRRPKYSFRAFYITVFLISALAVLSLLADQAARYRYGGKFGLAAKKLLVARRDHTKLGPKNDEECRLIHRVEDQCAFIKTNCPDEDSGLFSYLSLYYCGLAKAKPVAFAILALWLGLLFTTIGIAASDFFCINLSTISSILGMSESIAGVTFLAFGNGSPDVFSTFAAMSTHSGSLAVGELIGAAGFITAVVAGSMALVREFRVGKKAFVRDIGFFIVATSFTMVFLADGKLLLWECIAMVTFYLFYVAVVVIWHWYLGRQHKKRARDFAARGHFYTPGNEELEVVEDEEAEDGPIRRRAPQTPLSESFRTLERSNSRLQGDGGDDSGDENKQQRLVAAEMASEMRVTRPRHRRKNTLSAIRPSLVGALEFRSVLSSLQRSRSSHSAHIYLRRYSDESAALLDPLSDSGRSPETTVGISPGPLQRVSPPRLRAVTTNDIPQLNAFDVTNIPRIGISNATPSFAPDDLTTPSIRQSQSGTSVPPSPIISLSPPGSISGSRPSSPTPGPSRPRFDGTLAPPEPDTRVQNSRQLHRDDQTSIPSLQSQRQQPPRLLIPQSRSHSLEVSPVSSVTRFPLYTESPLSLTAQSSRSPLIIARADESLSITSRIPMEERPIEWWPYGFLPNPQVLLSTLFPTLYTWKSKSFWDKSLSLASAPSIFLLAITLPVVEPEGRDDEGGGETNNNGPGGRSTSRRNTHVALMPESPLFDPTPTAEWLQYHRESKVHERRNTATSPMTGSQYGAAAVAVNTENTHAHTHPQSPVMNPSPNADDARSPASNTPDASRDWGRWLLSIQIFTAPLFLVFVFWANADDGFDGEKLVKPSLYALLASLITYGILISTTTVEKPPKYRFLFCFVGFVVSIAWISTIANEVVAVLKAFGIILGISDAILGLTIFAVGNSLGDLIADITVARLGYPVMALSACFGGPMLNILLGIGVGGIYMTLTDASKKHHKHPKKPLKYKPYEIEVSGTLMVSAMTLLVTLVGLLIMVPMNKWMMTRKIGWALITLWVVSTVVNLAVEMTGVWGDAAS